MKTFTPLQLSNITLKNRLIRAATFEGMADSQGVPSAQLLESYRTLAQNEVALIISGFTYTSLQGKAMQPGQAGLDEDSKIADWKKIADQVHQYNCLLFAQISHTGRQTIPAAIQGKVLAPSSIKCSYFRARPKSMNEQEILDCIEQYGQAARRAKLAGLDGVQVHCAHGYLVHQFFSPHTNRRKDQWGGSLANRARFALHVFKRIKELCGPTFPIIIKISAGDDRRLRLPQVIELCQLIEQSQQVDAIEISYGTMEYAMNIFRGGLPIKAVLKHNALFRHYPEFIKKLWIKFVLPFKKRAFFPFSPTYNLQAALAIKEKVSLPIILTGGIRKIEEMEDILERGIAGISLCRPFIRRPDFAKRLMLGQSNKSDCINCNMCTVMCDSEYPTQCYLK